VPICGRFGVRKLSLFGSGLRGQETSTSDVDLRTSDDLSRHFRAEVICSAALLYAA
jgi:predicted nucleotidyltransferase